MHMNTLREKLASRKCLLGTHVNLNDHRICEMLGLIGFDYLWIDMEHLSTSLRDMETHLIAAKAAGTPALVRVCWNDIPHIKRVLEAGPDAIVIPMVNSVEEAQRAIDTCIYPPEGKRGFGPFRAVNYGISDVQEYINRGNFEMCRFLQIETREAVMSMEEMSKIPYIDGFIIGPVDLSGSAGSLGHCCSGETDRLIDLAIQKSRAANLPIGLSIGADDEENLTHWFSKGFDMISASTDAWSVIRGARELLGTMRRIAGEDK
jgi:4-hydroxy-2-oxoheptanedioate aldolase